MKDKLQKVLDRTAELEARRQEMEGLQLEARKSIQEQEAALHQELIAGRNGGKSLDTVTREKARVGAVDDALQQIEAELVELQREREKIEREIEIAEYEQTAAEVKKILFTCVNYLYRFSAALRTVPQYGPPRGYIPSADTQLIWHMLGHLRSLDIVRQVIEFERIAPQFMSEARKATKGDK